MSTAKQKNLAQGGASSEQNRGATAGLKALPQNSEGTVANSRPTLGSGSVDLAIAQKRAHRHFLSMVLVGAALIIVAGGLIFFAAGSNGPVVEGSLRRSRLAGDNLAYDTDEPHPGVNMAAKAKKRVKKTGRKRAAKSARARNTSRGRSTNKGRKNTARSGGNDEVDLGSGENSRKRELNGNDYARVFRKNGFAVQRCHERALKRDPFLEERKATAKVAVNSEGRVTKLTLVGVENKALRTCLNKMIRRFRFPKSRTHSNGQASLVFNRR